MIIINEVSGHKIYFVAEDKCNLSSFVDDTMIIT